MIVDLIEIGNQIFDDGHVRQRINDSLILVNAAKARQSVLSIDVHGARATDTFTARTTVDKETMEKTQDLFITASLKRTRVMTRGKKRVILPKG